MVSVVVCRHSKLFLTSLSLPPLSVRCLGYWVSNGLPETPMPKCVGSYLRFGSIRIEVRDEGPGITPQGKEILFREGVQLNANQLQSGQGLLLACPLSGHSPSSSHSFQGLDLGCGSPKGSPASMAERSELSVKRSGREACFMSSCHSSREFNLLLNHPSPSHTLLATV
jgi:hypothetical protein